MAPRRLCSCTKGCSARCRGNIGGKEAIGGTCLNVGCIPTKVLLHTTELYQTLLRGGENLGLKADNITVDWPVLQKRREQVVNRLVTGVGFLLRKANCQVLTGTAHLTGKKIK